MNIIDTEAEPAQCMNCMHDDIEPDLEIQSEDGLHFVVCKGCGFQGPEYEDKEDAILRWNRAHGHNLYEIPNSFSGRTYATFWKTVVESDQWEEWEKEVRKRLTKLNNDEEHDTVWDVDECRECGWISQDHFQDFIEFIKQ